jgi:hypothetical protein
MHQIDADHQISPSFLPIFSSGALRPDIFCLNACAGACSRAASWPSALQLLRDGGLKLDISSVNLAPQRQGMGTP